MVKQLSAREASIQLEAMGERLAKRLFPTLQKKGLALVVEQVRVVIKIHKRADTFELSDADWEKILSSHWNWTQSELQYLKNIRANNNQLTAIPEVALADGVRPYHFNLRIKTNFSRSREDYFLSENSRHWGCIGKRLTPRKTGNRKNP